MSTVDFKCKVFFIIRTLIHIFVVNLYCIINLLLEILCGLFHFLVQLIFLGENLSFVKSIINDCSWWWLLLFKIILSMSSFELCILIVTFLFHDLWLLIFSFLTNISIHYGNRNGDVDSLSLLLFMMNIVQHISQYFSTSILILWLWVEWISDWWII